MNVNEIAQNSKIRKRLFQVATQLFATQGYGSTSVSSIVEKAGVTKPVLYYYFGSKEGLFDALFSEHFLDFQSIMEKALLKKGDLKDKLTTLTREQFAYCIKYPARFRFVLQTVIGPEHGLGHLKFNKFKKLMGNKLSTMFSQAVACGQLQDQALDLLGLSYVGMVHMFMIKHAIDPEFELSSDTADILVELFMNGVGSPSNRQERVE